MKRKTVLFTQKRSLTDKKIVLQGFSKPLFWGIVLTMTVLFYVWTRVEVVRLNYSILEMSKKEKELFMKHEQLREELAILTSPSRLSSLAKSQLHLKDPSQHQIIYMK